jgi:hypothetical protein
VVRHFSVVASALTGSAEKVGVAPSALSWIDAASSTRRWLTRAPTTCS